MIRILAPKVHSYISRAQLEEDEIRAVISFIKTTMRSHSLTGAEIGVQYGINAENILMNLNMRKLYLIDPYPIYLECGRQTWYNGKEITKQRLQRFSDETVFIYDDAAAASKLISEPLDFAYIDGNHEYAYVQKDIAVCWPMIKPGGVLGGHDFHTRWPGVIKAVHEFTADKALNVGDGDWWVCKNET
jgi:predicted O-methyltransferase YrrM